MSVGRHNDLDKPQHKGVKFIRQGLTSLVDSEHLFADAWKEAYVAAVYIGNEDQPIKVRLVIVKTIVKTNVFSPGKQFRLAKWNYRRPPQSLNFSVKHALTKPVRACYN